MRPPLDMRWSHHLLVFGDFTFDNRDEAYETLLVAFAYINTLQKCQGVGEFAQLHREMRQYPSRVCRMFTSGVRQPPFHTTLYAKWSSGVCPV